MESFDQSSTKLKSIQKNTPKARKNPSLKFITLLIDMIVKAQKDNIKLSIVSAFRSYQGQKANLGE